MGSTIFTHMDEVRRRRRLAAIAAQAVKAGRLTEGRLDLALLLFGDPDVADDVEHFVDPRSIPEFENEIVKATDALRAIAKRLFQPIRSLDIDPRVAAVADQLSRVKGKGSAEREVSRRLEEHVAYLNQRMLYLALNRYLIDAYAVQFDGHQSTLVVRDFAKHGRSAFETVETVLASPNQAITTALAKKPHKSRGRSRKAEPANGGVMDVIPDTKSDAVGKVAAVGPDVAQQNGSEAREAVNVAIAPMAFDALQASPPQPLEIAGHGNSIENGIALVPQEKIIRATRLYSDDVHKFEYRQQKYIYNDEIARTIDHHVQTMNGRTVKYYKSDPSLVLNPFQVLHHFKNNNTKWRLNELLISFGFPEISWGFGGFLNGEPEDGFHHQLEMLKRVHHSHSVKLIRHPPPNNWPSNFRLKTDHGLLQMVNMFKYFRERWKGSAFRNSSRADDWWEHVYGYNMNVRYTVRQAEIALETLALLDMFIASEAGIKKPHSKYGKTGSFYQKFRVDQNWAESFHQGKLMTHASRLSDEFIGTGGLPQIIEQSHFAAKEFEEQRLVWAADLKFTSHNQSGDLY